MLPRMAQIRFTPNLRRHLQAPDMQVPGGDVRGALEAAFAVQPMLRSYLLDDQGALRRHVSIFVDGQRIADRNGLGDAVGAASEVLVMQALTGGAS